MMAAMDELRAMADALWGDWRPKLDEVRAYPELLALAATIPPI
jgi:hypothetical protein